MAVRRGRLHADARRIAEIDPPVPHVAHRPAQPCAQRVVVRVHFQKTVAATLADPDLAEWSQKAELKIQGHIDTMKAETGLTDDEIIPIPTYFEDLGGGNILVAWNPGMVNMRLIGDRAYDTDAPRLVRRARDRGGDPLEAEPEDADPA